MISIFYWTNPVNIYHIWYKMCELCKLTLNVEIIK